jgi:hypothetical protein
MTPEARAGLRLDRARVARLLVLLRCARMRDCAAATAGGLRAGPSVDVDGDRKGLGVSPPVSRCSAAGERQPLKSPKPSSLSRTAVIAGLMLFSRVCNMRSRCQPCMRPIAKPVLLVTNLSQRCHRLVQASRPATGLQTHIYRCANLFLEPCKHQQARTLSAPS